ncbi:hypothetical protein AB5N19_03879 [Seiridium cardinale]
MSNRRRYKKRFRSSNLDPSWIIPDDEHDGLSITPSNPSDAASVSSSLADRGNTRDLVRPDHSDRPSSSSGPAPNLGSGTASSFDVSNAEGFSYASSNSSVQLAPSSRDEEDARKSEVDGSAALLNPEQTGQAKGRRKKRYVRKHASDWLIDNQDSTSPNTGNGPTSATQPAPQSPDRDDRTWRATAPPPDGKRSTDIGPVADTSPPGAAYSIFRRQRPSHNSPGYDAPPIAPQAPATYSPSFTFH